MRDFLTVIFAAFIVIVPMTVLAQSDNDEAKRLDLAKQMHVIKPVQPEIEDAVRMLALRIPEDRREIFISKMLNAFDQKTLNGISVKAMAETFTVDELEAMIAYFSSEEGRSIDKKMPVYWALVKPEIAKLMDKAMMDVRLGPKPE